MLRLSWSPRWGRWRQVEDRIYLRGDTTANYGTVDARHGAALGGPAIPRSGSLPSARGRPGICVRAWSYLASVHVLLLVLGLVNLGLTEPLRPTVQSIAVDLVPIEEFSNIRLGQLDSEVVETETPSAVESEEPAELAQPTGNTEQDQVTPSPSRCADASPGDGNRTGAGGRT